MFNKNNQDNPAEKYIRAKINQARTEAGDTQADLARILGKTRVTVSDIERGRVSVGAADLALIAAYYQKPISFFFNPQLSIHEHELSQLEQELIALFQQLPDNQQYIALEYIKQQVEVSNKAISRRITDSLLNEEIDKKA